MISIIFSHDKMCCHSQVVYRTDDTNTLYIMAYNESQQNDWINAIRSGWYFLSIFLKEKNK